jgi:hypothetical protein
MEGLKKHVEEYVNNMGGVTPDTSNSKGIDDLLVACLKGDVLRIFIERKWHEMKIYADFNQTLDSRPQRVEITQWSRYTKTSPDYVSETNEWIKRRYDLNIHYASACIAWGGTHWDKDKLQLLLKARDAVPPVGKDKRDATIKLARNMNHEDTMQAVQVSLKNGIPIPDDWLKFCIMSATSLGVTDLGFEEDTGTAKVLDDQLIPIFSRSTL